MKVDLIKLAEANGMEAANATHRKRDAAMARRFREQERALEAANPAILKELAEAYCTAYREEASYYIGALA